jgi:hypothetical protein
MSVVFPPGYFAIPNKFFELGYSMDMDESELRLYVFLLFKANRLTNRQLAFTNKDVAKQAGLSQRNLTNARKALSGRGLILCIRKSAKWVYTFCDPETRQPYSGDPKLPPPRNLGAPTALDKQQRAEKVIRSRVAADRAFMAFVQDSISEASAPMEWSITARRADPPRIVIRGEDGEFQEVPY